MRKTVVFNVVGLTPLLLRHMPRLSEFARRGAVASVGHVTPAVTCSVQATYLTGCLPTEHGIVGNGWYDRDEREIRFWKQSDGLVQRPRVWEIARACDAGFTCANLFWWYAMYSRADTTVTPRPMYPADGRKIPDVWTHPPSLRDQLQRKLGRFPLFNFWGPRADIVSSRWIADASLDLLPQHTLTLVYLPHLDYALQKFGPDDPRSHAAAVEIDVVIGELLAHAQRHGAGSIVLSEYGIEPVNRPVHINRILREHGLVAIRDELGRDLLDPGASAAFAVADHQVAHVYVNDPEHVDAAERIVAETPGVEQVLRGAARVEAGLNHRRAGDLVAVASPGAWFTYYHWLDDARAPDFARTVDIHRKPGYDPAELFVDPSRPMMGARITWKLMKRRMGFRTLLDVIPLDASLVKGSHGRRPSGRDAAPMLIAERGETLDSDTVAATDVCRIILRNVFG